MTESGRRINRVAYIGTPAIAVDPLLKLVEEGYDIPLVVTGPDKRRGRGSSTSPSDVKREAERLGLNVSSNIDDLVSIDVDLAIVHLNRRVHQPFQSHKVSCYALTTFCWHDS